MLQKLKHTVKHTAIYSLGTIATKFIGIILLPLYIKHITVTEYGILGVLEVTILILTQTLSVGQHSSFLRLYNIKESDQKNGQTFFTIFIFILLLMGCFNIFGQLLVNPVACFFSQPDVFATYFRLCISIISLRVINQLFLANLRAREKSLLYSLGNCIKIALILSFNIYFVAYRELGVQGILYAYLIGDLFLFCFLFLQMVGQMIPKFDYSVFKTSLYFGLPLIFAGLTHMLLNMGDRYILKALINYNEVGLYNLGYKVAGILNVFFIHSFQMSLLPIAYKTVGQKGDKRFFSKMLTYFSFILIWSGLALSIVARDIFEIYPGKETSWWAAYSIIPVIVFSYILSGIKMVINLGLYIKKKTKLIAYSIVGALIINIILNMLLIPHFRMMGAAIATVIAFFILTIITYLLANHWYPIPYEIDKLIKMLVVAILLFFTGFLTTNLSVIIRISIKTIMISLFPVILYFINFYEEIELQKIREMGKKIYRRT